MINFDKLQLVLMVAVGSGLIMTNLTQKIKEYIQFKNSKSIMAIAFILNIVVGVLFSLSFSDLNIVNGLWVGLFSFIGADILYKTFEDKFFKPFKEIKKEDIEKIVVE